ncbi:hypothetical protein Tdes44962_MAKER08346 [Teratosphaeria destructans]|uniref:Uncharacterized protein n=1 Tax=Teratosphaeria destructans TaxID=418781 RepID=A0A9W7SXB6_9PEZI|nr:hypothetical protein Tdes44962_MAKER08346 [Teratosphaeria destructans]
MQVAFAQPRRSILVDVAWLFHVSHVDSSPASTKVHGMRRYSMFAFMVPTVPGCVSQVRHVEELAHTDDDRGEEEEPGPDWAKSPASLRLDSSTSS